MSNPLSSLGWSDRDYAAAVGTLMGEAAVKGTIKDYQAVADVIANRAAAGVYGKGIAGITMNPSQFSTWSPKQQGAYQNALMGFTAALNPERVGKMPKAAQERFSLATQAVADVNLTGKARGIAQGATAYHNPEVTAKQGTDAWHKQQEDKYGALTIDQHTFTGKGFRPDQPFDNITYNGQLAAPPAAETFFGDVVFGDAPVSPAPSGVVENLGTVPDITPQGNLPSAGFDFASFDPGGYTLGDLAPDIEQSFGLNDFSSQPAPAGFSMDQSQFSAGFPSAPEAFGPSMNEMGQPQEAGYVAGLDAGPWGATPDFSAPSLDQRNAETLAQDRVKGFESGLVPGFRQNDIDQLNAGLMAEFGQPSLAAAPLSAQTVQSAPQAPSFDLASMPMGDLNLDRTTATPAPQSQSLPSATSPVAAKEDGFSLGPVGFSVDKGLTIGGFSNPIDAVKSGLGFDTIKDNAFMNGMASPDYANSYSPGFMDSAIGRGLTGAVQGGLFGGIPGAAIGGTLGATGWGNAMGNQLDNFFGGMVDHALQGWDNYDFATHGYGPGFNSLGERSHTGRDDSGNATMGDGSYSESSGRNDNNPQGIY